MSKVIDNTSKTLEILSNGGRYKLVSRMKVDYDSNNDVFGARRWVFTVIDLVSKKTVNLQKNGIDVFKNKEYQYKKELIGAIDSAGCFSNALFEMKKRIKQTI